MNIQSPTTSPLWRRTKASISANLVRLNIQLGFKKTVKPRKELELMYEQLQQEFNKLQEPKQ